MIALQFLSLVFGVALVLAVLGSALETVVLPQEGFSRLSQAVFATTYGLLVHRRNSVQARSLRSLYAPVSLVSLPLVWMIVTVIAFTFVFWGTGNVAFQRAFEHSASSLTTLGFSEPSGTGKIVIAFVEATIGLGLVALLISFLPTIYTAYNGREKGINRLRPVAGAPPNATQLLQTLRRIGAFEGIDFWRSQADWLLDLEQTHTAFPFLTYFPETHTDHSWVATVGSLLDSAALVVATTDDEGDEVYQDAEKGPIMVVVYGLPLIVRIARAANVPLPPFQGLPDLSARAAASAPEIAVTRAEYDAALDALDTVLVVPPDRREEAWRRFSLLRSAYEPALRALAGLTAASPAPWTTDRPADVGRPRFLRRRPLHVDWSMLPPVQVPTVGDPATGG